MSIQPSPWKRGICKACMGLLMPWGKLVLEERVGWGVAPDPHWATLRSVKGNVCFSAALDTNVALCCFHPHLWKANAQGQK